MIRFHFSHIPKHELAALQECGTEGPPRILTIDERSGCYRAVMLARSQYRAADKPTATTDGPGTELMKLLHRFGIRTRDGCPCEKHAAEMDRRGSAWCLGNIEMIVGWLADEANARSLPFSPPAATLLVQQAIQQSVTSPPP